jgi:hypothetical protein
MIDKTTPMCIRIVVAKTILDGNISRRRNERFKKIKSGVVINECDDYTRPLNSYNFSRVFHHLEFSKN